MKRLTKVDPKWSPAAIHDIRAVHFRIARFLDNIVLDLLELSMLLYLFLFLDVSPPPQVCGTPLQPCEARYCK